MNSVRIPFAILLLLAAVSCGGGSSSSGIPTPALIATFNPLASNPAGQAVFMDAGGRSGATFTVRVMAANIDDLFGVAFRVLYDPNTVAYVGSDSSASVLAIGGYQTDFSTALASPGVLFVTATRIQDNPFVPGRDIAGPEELVSLTFRVLQRTGRSDLDFNAWQADTCDAISETCSTASPAWSGGWVAAN